MTPIAVAERAGAPNYRSGGARELLGVKSTPESRLVLPTTSTTGAGPGAYDRSSDERSSRDVRAFVPPVPETRAAPALPAELQKAVRRMPALYVIAFFGVVVSCAVLIIWNTLQVNRLTSERNKLDDQIAQTTQRLIRLRAEEMQLSAQSRVRQIAQDKLGMTEVTPEDVVVAH